MCILGMRTMSLMLGWVHLIAATASSIFLLVLICTYHSESYDDRMDKEDLFLGLGLPKVMLLFLFCVTDSVFALLLIKGIKEERHRLMAPFVYAHYVALGFLVIIIIIYFVADLIEATFMELVVDFIANCARFALTLLLIWPAHVLYHQMRLYPDQFEQQWHSDVHPADKHLHDIPGEMV
ncbi:uncharacterized protein LOC131997603 [Stomoxys calcitrans]|uniref:uncharacterized protein LOC131997603 n=1 Tax=Stomoxys calcitrans TaxID=35570 RepID=UPI0027E260B6|nr:uncharacterized protein LOC131997603 [Stomoxys calcitrans]